MAPAAGRVDAQPMTTSDTVRVIEPGAGHTVPFLDGSVMTFLARGSDTDDLVSFWEFNLPAGGQGPPPHVHNGHDEMFYVVEGDLTVFTAGEPRDVGPGTLVFVPRGAQHTFANHGTTPMRMVGTFSPARFEHYFDEL